LWRTHPAGRFDTPVEALFLIRARQQAPAFLGGKDSITTARWWFTPAWTGLFHRQPAMAVATVH